MFEGYVGKFLDACEFFGGMVIGWVLPKHRNNG